jgi:hypothetical protein
MMAFVIRIVFSACSAESKHEFAVYDRQKYITDYQQKGVIWLDADNIKWNPGLRSLAKLMFNRYDEFCFMFTLDYVACL